MKILWFTNTPSLAEDFLNNKQMNGGFIKSLEKIIQDKVDLSIAFYHSKELAPFTYGKTRYFPINQDSDSVRYKINTRVFNHLEPKTDVKKFINIIEEARPDVIHIHGTEGPFGLVQSFSSVPTVVSIQGNISVYELKFFSGIPLSDVFKYSGLKSWLTFNNNAHYFARFKKRSRREKEIFKLSKNIIGRTSWDRRIAKILSPAASYFHNDEVLRDVFYEGAWQNNLAGTLKLFTTTGSNIYKGIETLIYCAHLLDANNINFNWKVAGISNQDDIVRIAAKSIKKKISKNIQFLGKASDQTLKESILSCNMYVAISHIENSPNSLCEALILGAPCIATNAGGISTFIKDGINGILIQDGDPYSMAGAIIDMTENYDMAIKYGINARKSALPRHDKNTIASDLLDIYQHILKKKG